MNPPKFLNKMLKIFLYTNNNIINNTRNVSETKQITTINVLKKIHFKNQWHIFSPTIDGIL